MYKLLQKIKKKIVASVYVIKNFQYHFKFFKQIDNQNEQIKFTARNLKFVEIEIFSFCNRKCWFCPNSFIDRHSKNIFMDEDVYLNILEQLKGINYRGIISYARYNEPLSDKIFITRVRQAREYLPKAILYTHSNGDYATPEYLDELANAGLNLIRFQCYLEKDENFGMDSIFPKVQKLSEKLGLTSAFSFEESSSLHYVFNLSYKKMRVLCDGFNFKDMGTTRGASLSTIKPGNRTSPCFSPFYKCHIDYDGSVMPCCEVRHDNEKHQSMIMGNINNNTIYEIFSNKKFSNLRNDMYVHGKKNMPCALCSGTICDTIYDNSAINMEY